VTGGSGGNRMIRQAVAHRDPHRWQRQRPRFKTLWRSAEYDSASRRNPGRLCRTGI
jgi:hypothetical protein